MEADDQTRNQLAELRASTETARMCAEQIIEGQRLNAKFLRAKYLALIEEGFAAAEALAIIQARGCM